MLEFPELLIRGYVRFTDSSRGRARGAEKGGGGGFEKKNLRDGG